MYLHALKMVDRDIWLPDKKMYFYIFYLFKSMEISFYELFHKYRIICFRKRNISRMQACLFITEYLLHTLYNFNKDMKKM